MNGEKKGVRGMERGRERDRGREREIVEGRGWQDLFEVTEGSLPSEPVCTFDPKILRSFPFGQRSRREVGR